jgi:hypothetical protein
MPRPSFSILVVTAFLASGAARAPQDAQTAPATVKDVMVTMTIPASDAIFSAASDPPRSEEQWEELRKSAETLAASGRLLMRTELARDTTTWIERARALVTQAETTVTLAGAKAGDRLEQAGDDVYATCEACHERYFQP